MIFLRRSMQWDVRPIYQKRILAVFEKESGVHRRRHDEGAFVSQRVLWLEIQRIHDQGERSMIQRKAALGMLVLAISIVAAPRQSAAQQSTSEAATPG